MTNYNFSTLNDKEFEQLSKDLLNAKFKFGLQDFKAGKDKGIDLRCSTATNDNEIVVQVKHYVGSGFPQLKHTLLNKELDKINRINPKRYLVVTSLSLSANQKDELKGLLQPFVISSNDIFGQEDLNGFLKEFEKIEKNCFKLWFSSIAILESVINNAVEGRTKYLLERIKEKIPFYVITKKLDSAKRVLQKEKLLLITGQPGIGKTTLTEIILFDRAKNGFQIYKVENILEAENAVSPDPDAKQVFYFDDFLGANYFEIINVNKTETQLTSFLERVKASPNKYLILTTRTVILNQAVTKYEKINHSNIASRKFEINLDDYDKYEKALILYNHLYFRKVDEHHLDEILTDKFYSHIIQHANYTPRIIEFITEKTRISNLSGSEYKQFILNNLKNPKEIWRYSFTNQIEYFDKCLLLTLFTFGNQVSEQILLNAFTLRSLYEKEEHNQILTSNQFYTSIEVLLNGFISSELYNVIPPVREFTFINPSLGDFLIGYIAESFSERKGIISSIKYVEQLHRFNPDKKLLPLEQELQIIILRKIENEELQTSENLKLDTHENSLNTILIDVLSRYCSLIDTDSSILKLFQKLNFNRNWSTIAPTIKRSLLALKKSPQTFAFIKGNFIEFAEKLISSITNKNEAIQVPALFHKYEHNYQSYLENFDGGLDNVLQMITNVLQESEDDIINENADTITDIDAVPDLYDSIDDLESSLISELIPNTDLDYDFGVSIDMNYWKKKIDENNDRLEDAASRYEDYEQNYYKEILQNRRDTDQAIDDLFTKNE